MKTVAQYDWTTRAEPKDGEIAGRPGKWDRQAELLLSDVDRNGEPTPIGDIHVGQLMTVTSPVGAADLTVTAVNGLRLSVGVVNGYLYPINGQVVSVKWADPPLSDNFDPTPLWGAINTEIAERQEGDADLQDQIDNHQHNTDHTHPDYSLTSHDHDTAYSPAGHTHSGLTPGPHDHPHDHDADYSAVTHNHDGVYEPVHDHPYATNDELAAEKKAREDADDALNAKITDEIDRSTKKDKEHTESIDALGEALGQLQSELPVREYTYTTSRSPVKGEMAALDALAQPVTAWENTTILAMGNPDTNGVPLDLSTHFPGEIVRISDRGELSEPDESRLARMGSSYLVAEITEVNISGSLNVTPLYYDGRPDPGDDLLLEILPPAGGVDTGELDKRYAQKSHTHNYAAANHSHSGQGGFTPDHDWDQYTHQQYDGDVIHRQTYYAYPREPGDWTAQGQDNNIMASSAQTHGIYQLGIYPPYGTAGWHAGHTGLIMFGETKWSQSPIVVFQVIGVERDTNYFRWYVRQIWTCNTTLQVRDLDGKSFLAKQGAVYK